MGSITDQASLQPTPITVSLADLKHGTIPLSTLEAAFGPQSLGILLVSDLPPSFPTLRSKLLSHASFLANLPAAVLEKLECPAAKYNVGWSCGKEKLASGLPDGLKGSFYAAPPCGFGVGEEGEAEARARARRDFADLAEMVAANVWPEESVLPGFRAAFEDLCRVVVDVAGDVARACDRFGVERVEGYRAGVLEGIVRGSVSAKARLLHYFPPPPTTTTLEEESEDDWCGTHLDLGALTGLTSNMYVDEDAFPPALPGNGTIPDLKELSSHPDSNAGLWIKDRAGRTTKVSIPRDCLAFQTGQALELITKGKFKAVPHFVRGGKAGGKIARNTLAVFTQPNLWEVVDEQSGKNFATLAREVFGRTY